jgi:hypothetical protein
LREKKEVVEDGARGTVGLDLVVREVPVERCEEEPPPKKLMM